MKVFAVAALSLLLLPLYTTRAQNTAFKISNNEKLVLAESASRTRTDEARMIADSFFVLAGRHHYDQWLELLSKECFANDSVPLSKTKGWWNQVSASQAHYAFVREDKSSKTNQRFFRYKLSDSDGQTTEHYLILVSEHNHWCVYSFK